jgi:hypothetical protein
MNFWWKTDAILQGGKLMTTMFVRHTVSDYKAWRKAYDDFAPVQKAKGVTAQAVYRAADNPNDITIFFRIPGITGGIDPTA